MSLAMPEAQKRLRHCEAISSLVEQPSSISDTNPSTDCNKETALLHSILEHSLEMSGQPVHSTGRGGDANHCNSLSSITHHEQARVTSVLMSMSIPMVESFAKASRASPSTETSLLDVVALATLASPLVSTHSRVKGGALPTLCLKSTSATHRTSSTLV